MHDGPGGAGGSRLDGRRRVGREAGYSQLASVPYASMAPASATRLTQMCLHTSEAGLCLITAVLEKPARKTQRCMPARPIFLNGLKRGTHRACNLLNGKLSPQTSSRFLKGLKKIRGPQQNPSA